MNLIQLIRWFVKSNSTKAKRARQATNILFLVALFIILFWIVPVEKVIPALLKADPFYICLGISLGFLTTYLTALEMTVLVHKQRISLGVNGVLAVNLAAKFYSQFAPGNIVASGVKWYRLSQPDGKPAEALAALAFFRLLEVSLNVITGLTFWILSGNDAIQINVLWPLALIVAVTVIWFTLTRYSLPAYTRFTDYSSKVIENPRWQSLLERLRKFVLAVSAYNDLKLWELFLAVFAGLCSILVGVLSNLYLAKAVGIELSLMDMGWIYAVIILLSQLPFAVAGGLGIREVSLVYLLSDFGIDPELALAFSFLLFIRGIVISLLGGVLEAFRVFRADSSPDLTSASNKAKEP